MPHRPGYQSAVELTVSLCLTYTLCVAGLRIWIRRKAYGLDDAVIGVATLVTISNAAVNYLAMSQGLGLPWSTLQDSESLGTLNEASVAGAATFLTALYLSKASLLLFLARLTKTPRQILLFRLSNAFVLLLGIISIILATADCQTTTVNFYWTFSLNSSTCPSQPARWATITTLDVLTEVILLGLPIHLVWALQMPLRKKAIILIAFWLRLPVIAFSLARQVYTSRLADADPESDAGLEASLVVIWMGIELAYALAASTLSALKGFTESFNSDFGLGFTRGKGEGRSYNLSAFSGDSSKHEKSSKSPSALESGNQQSTVASSPSPHLLDRTKGDGSAAISTAPVTRPITPLSTRPLTSDPGQPPLRLRPDTMEGETYTRVTASPVEVLDRAPWSACGGSASSRDSCDAEAGAGMVEMVIVRETGYEVYSQHRRSRIEEEETAVLGGG